MKIGDIVEFKKTKNRYRIAGYGRMKDPKGNGWFDAVIYETYMDYDPDEDDYNRAATSNIYVREKDDFEEKFEFSIPKVQIYSSETGQPIYEFGVSEKLLSTYFDLGFGGNRSIHSNVKDPNTSIEAWCQTLAGDILIGEMNTADERLTQEVLDQIKSDLAAGKFGENIVALGKIQMLIFFLTIPMDASAAEPVEEGAVPEFDAEAPAEVPVEEVSEDQ